MPIKPIVSVLLPVYNSEEYLDDAIKSILNQTFKEFEFIIIIDGCTDRSLEIAQSYKDSRINLINNKDNKGFVYRLNESLALAKGQYISIMNADDIALSDKLEKQISLLKSDKDIGICGTWIERFGKYNDILKHPSEHHNIMVDLFYGNPFAHPTVVFNKSLLKSLPTWYDENYATAEDFDFFQRLILFTKGKNISEVLLKYRTHSSQITEVHQQTQNTRALELRKRFFETVFFKLTPEDLFCWNKLINNEFFEFSETIRLFNLITKIKNTPQTILSAASLNEFTYRLERLIYDKYLLFEKDQHTVYRENFTLKDKIVNLDEEILQLKKVKGYLAENKALITENDFLSLKLLPKVENLKEDIASNINEKLKHYTTEQEKTLEKQINILYQELNNIKGENEKMNSNNNELKNEHDSLVMEVINGYRNEIEVLRNQHEKLLDKQNDPISFSMIMDLNNKICEVYNQLTESQKESSQLREVINIKTLEINESNSKIEILKIKENEQVNLKSTISDLMGRLEKRSEELMSIKFSEDNLKLENARLYELIETQQAELLKLQIGTQHTIENNSTPVANNIHSDELTKTITEKDEIIEKLTVKNKIYQNYQENFISQRNNLEQRIKLLEDLIQHMRMKSRLKRLFRIKGF
jgi:glycosyltransferase involved in cell wall biosynthesis